MKKLTVLCCYFYLFVITVKHFQTVPLVDREVVARLRNCILALAASKMLLFDTSINYAFEQSQKYQVLSFKLVLALLSRFIYS